MPSVASLDTSQFKPWPAAGLLVGGAVRDALLGHTSRDLDWLVADPAAAAHASAALSGGSVVVMDEARGHWRVVEPGGVVHDFAPLRSGATTVEDDLRLRDLTVNALALNAAGTVLDPSGGLPDLRAKRLRATHQGALAADPIRSLRTARLATTLGFTIEAATRAEVRRLAAVQAADPTAKPAAERIGAELAALIAAPRAATGFALLNELGLLAAYLPELIAGRGVGQGGFHHLDVLDHSLEALNQLLHGFPDASAALRWATLLHDVGKPGSAARLAGRSIFYGHDRLGADLTRRLLRRLRLPNEVVERATALVRYHMLPLPRSERAAKRFVHRRRELLPDLLKLMIADREASRGPLASAAGREAYRVALSRVLAVLQEEAPPRPLLSGHEVMALLNLPPGPRVGAALALVAEARAVGDVQDRAEAEALLQRYAAAQGWLASDDEAPL